jgi:predicted Ser/Thr protein kinase
VKQLKAERREVQRKGALRQQQEGDVRLNVFSGDEVRSATDDFHEERKLGEGTFGAVFSGRLRGAAVAVKQLKQRPGRKVRPSTPTSHPP